LSEFIKIELKPLSVNEAWRGRRFKTREYAIFERNLLLLLPSKIELPKSKKYKIHLHFGLSSLNGDGDNCIKQSQDIIAKKYKFNDRIIYKWDIEKFDVPKGKEFIKFKIEEYEQNISI
jgi:hypothetical protein